MIKSFETQRVHNAMIDQLVRQEVIRILSDRETAEARREEHYKRQIKQLRAEIAEYRRREAERCHVTVAGLMKHALRRLSDTALARAAWALVGYMILGADALRQRMGV